MVKLDFELYTPQLIQINLLSREIVFNFHEPKKYSSNIMFLSREIGLFRTIYLKIYSELDNKSLCNNR